jgi:hypothetical protein
MNQMWFYRVGLDSEEALRHGSQPSPLVAIELSSAARVNTLRGHVVFTNGDRARSPLPAIVLP